MSSALYALLRNKQKRSLLLVKHKFLIVVSGMPFTCLNIYIPRTVTEVHWLTVSLNSKPIFCMGPLPLTKLTVDNKICNAGHSHKLTWHEMIL